MAKSRKKPERKQVSDWIHFKVEGGQSDTQIGVTKDGKLICPQANPESIVSYSSYDRASGKEKVVRQAPSGYLNQRQLIETEYDAIAGVDTNDFDLTDGRHVSICASFASKPVLKNHAENVFCDITPAFIVESPRTGLNPEVLGWYLFLKYVYPLLPIAGDQKLAVVVDSELNDLASFNHRKTPYYGDYYLPKNVELIYASSDTGTELPNKLMRKCDRLSRDVYKMIDEGSLALPETLGGGSDDCAGFAYINFPNSPYLLEVDWP